MLFENRMMTLHTCLRPPSMALICFAESIWEYLSYSLLLYSSINTSLSLWISLSQLLIIFCRQLISIFSPLILIQII